MVCKKISGMKTTWADVANSNSFNDTLDTKLTKEDSKFSVLEKKIMKFLGPYDIAKEFLSWSLTQMSSVDDSESSNTDSSDADTSVSKTSVDYPESGYDDIVLEEYLNGAVIIMNLDKWINPTKPIDVDLEKRRLLAFKDYVKINKLAYKRIFVKSTIQCKKSITNHGLITFRTKS